MRISALILSLAVAFPVLADTVRVREDAPDRHVVVKGDTLWDISAKFLSTPWKWPELWQLNKNDIANPHLIYPGDVIVLIMTPDGPRLAKLETVKLGPRVLSTPIFSQVDAIPTVPPEAVEPFIAHAGVIYREKGLALPRILGGDDDRVFLTMGDNAYANRGDGITQKWHIVRPGIDLIDPETGQSLGQEAIHVGDAETVAEGTPLTLRVTRATAEVTKGDRLVPAAPTTLMGMVPRAPERPIEGKLISAYGGASATSRYATVVINKGRVDGLAPGHVLAIYRPGRTIGGSPEQQAKTHRAGDLAVTRKEPVEYRSLWEEFLDFIDPLDFFFQAHEDGKRGWRYADTKCLKEGVNLAPGENYDPAAAMEECKPEDVPKRWAYMDIGCLKYGKSVTYDQTFDPKEVYEPHCRPQPPIKLPDVRSGLVMVYRVFDRVSYALVMESQGPIYLLDTARNP
jgi:hypothetical protein